MFTSDEEKEQQAKLLALVHQAIERDEALRKKFEIGDKFRFVRERLKEVLTHLEADQSSTRVVTSDIKVDLQEGEVAVYVYLFNTKGAVLRSWINMVSPKVFYEYSVNRPIYAEKTQVDAMLRAKTDKPQHAYLTVAVKASDILQSTSDTLQKDSLGNPLVKVREGSLKIDKLITFTHNGHEYRLSPEGEFIKNA